MWNLVLATLLLSLSGVMAPGPVTAYAVNAGTRSAWAGVLVGLGHAAVELPLILLVYFGLVQWLSGGIAQTIVLALGGALLLYMAYGTLRGLLKGEVASDTLSSSGPIVAGIMLSAGNAYFLLWWLSVGAELIGEAALCGFLGIVMLVAVHWACDVGWLLFLSAASYFGVRSFGRRFHTGIVVFCSLLLGVFGVLFLKDAFVSLSAA